MKYIKQEDAVSILKQRKKELIGIFGDLGDAASRAAKLMESLPSYDFAEPSKHEECEYVITKGKAGYHEEYKCSACGDSFYWTQDKAIPRRFNYCRNCGRKITQFIEKEVNTVRRESE